MAAARHIIGLAVSFQVVLPLSSAHMSETCKQVDSEERYLRALKRLKEILADMPCGLGGLGP